MNKQPYTIPPRWWAPKLSPWWVGTTRRYRRSQLRRQQRLLQIECQEQEHLQRAISSGAGVLITPNHSTHYDSAALYVAADDLHQPLYFMTAWQVFAMSPFWERWAMQRLGCFSIDRESSDRKAYKQAVAILQDAPHPLVVFPEGDIYHANDRVTPFREGAAAIALSAARRALRDIVIVPCGIKFWYIDDPTEELEQLMERLELRLLLRPRPELRLTDRIYRFAEALLALKEIDYLGRTQTGELRSRIHELSQWILDEMELRHDVAVKARHDVPQRVKELRKNVISKFSRLDETDAPVADATSVLSRDMDSLFLVMQLFSYPGDYLLGNPSVERLAETLDKFEEDVLMREFPSVRGRRRVSVRFGEPVSVEAQAGGRGQVAALNGLIQDRVQELLDRLNGVPHAPQFQQPALAL